MPAVATLACSKYIKKSETTARCSATRSGSIASHFTVLIRAKDPARQVQISGPNNVSPGLSHCTVQVCPSSVPVQSLISSFCPSSLLMKASGIVQVRRPQNPPPVQSCRSPDLHSNSFPISASGSGHCSRQVFCSSPPSHSYKPKAALGCARQVSQVTGAFQSTGASAMSLTGSHRASHVCAGPPPKPSQVTLHRSPVFVPSHTTLSEDGSAHSSSLQLGTGSTYAPSTHRNS
mmetsp:Transcript_92313/g.211311  ORF Transcript_92313/g.211311 Transcript_92313/m.211311 type:complete len:233 (-) Transcript_92313:2562-3260(-)